MDVWLILPRSRIDGDIEVGKHVVFIVEQLTEAGVVVMLPAYDYKKAMIPIQNTEPRGYIAVLSYDVAVVSEIKDNEITLTMKNVDPFRREVALDMHMEKLLYLKYMQKTGGHFDCIMIYRPQKPQRPEHEEHVSQQEKRSSLEDLD